MNTVIRSNSGYIVTIKSSPTVLKQESREIGFLEAVVEKKIKIVFQLRKAQTNKMSSFSLSSDKISVLLPSVIEMETSQSTSSPWGTSEVNGGLNLVIQVLMKHVAREDLTLAGASTKQLVPSGYLCPLRFAFSKGKPSENSSTFAAPYGSGIIRKPVTKEVS